MHINHYFLAPPVPFNVTIQKPVCKNSEVDFVVSWNMPDPNLYFVSLYFIICEQLRRGTLWNFLGIQRSELKATLSASCPGEIVSAKVKAFGSDSFGQVSEKSLPYQTGKSLQCYCYCSSVKNMIGTCIQNM